MKTKQAFLVLLLATAALLAGCVNLAAVRDVAKQAESLSAHSAIPQDFVDTSLRRQSWLTSDPIPEPQLAQRKQYREDFENQQAVLTKYFAALAALAGQDAISFQKNLDEAATAAGKSGVMEAVDAGRFAAAANVALRLATDGARNRHLRSIIERLDPAVQNVTKVMIETLREDYGDSLKREVQARASLNTDISAENNPTLKRLAAYVTRDAIAAEEKRAQAAEAYVKGLEKIGQAHATLAANLTDFTRKELVVQLREYEDDLKTLQKKL